MILSNKIKNWCVYGMFLIGKSTFDSIVLIQYIKIVNMKGWLPLLAIPVVMIALFVPFEECRDDEDKPTIWSQIACPGWSSGDKACLEMGFMTICETKSLFELIK